MDDRRQWQPPAQIPAEAVTRRPSLSNRLLADKGGPSLADAQLQETNLRSANLLAELDLPADHNEAVKRELAKIEKEKKEPIIP